MTSVANQSVGADGLSRTGAGTKSNVGNCAGFLGAGEKPDGSSCGGVAGTQGGALGPGAGAMPKSTAGVLTSIEKPLKAGS